MAEPCPLSRAIAVPRGFVRCSAVLDRKWGMVHLGQKDLYKFRCRSRDFLIAPRPRNWKLRLQFVKVTVRTMNHAENANRSGASLRAAGQSLYHRSP